MRRAIAIVGTVAGLAVLGEAGHVAFERLGWGTAHHAFHILYPRRRVRGLRRRGDPGSARP